MIPVSALLDDRKSGCAMLRWRGRSVSPLRFSPAIFARSFASRRLASMSTIPPAPTFKPFNLALIQLGQVGADKNANLRHARDMIRRAANGEGAGIVQGKPDLIVLPVSTLCAVHAIGHLQGVTVARHCRNASTRLMATCISHHTRRISDLHKERNIMSRLAKA